MKIYLTTENGAYIAEIDRLLYKNIAEILGNKKKEENFSKQQLEANKLEEFFEEKIITLSKKDSIDKYIEKKLKKYFFQILQILEEKGIKIMEANISMIPENNVELDQKSYEKIERLVETLEDNDDVQNVYHNAVEAE